MKSSRTGSLIAAVSLLAAAVGCGDSPATSDGTSAGGRFPVTVQDATGKITVQHRPDRIVSLSPSATEMLFEIGAGEQVVAVDDQSDYPSEAPLTDLSAYQPNVEAIAGYRPDLVIAPADVPGDVIAGLEKLGLTVVAEPAAETLADAYHQMRELGLVTGHAEAGEELAAEVRAEVGALVSEAPEPGSLSVFHELDPELFSASSETFIGRIYERLGLGNVADRAAERAGTPYPQLSSEAVVSSDPDLIVLADSECCDQSPAKVGERPGWGRISAVSNHAVVAIDDDIASRWGPRIPIFVARVIDAIRAAQAGAVE